MIYLDNAATTYPKPNEVYEALDFANKNFSFNAGRGTYKEAQECINVINECRNEIASFIKKDGKTVTLTSSATEALNIIIYGLGIEEGDNVYISPFEHNAIVRPLYNLQKHINFSIHILKCNENTWDFEIDDIKNSFALNPPKACICSQVSNVTGFKPNYESLFTEAKKYNSLTILDSAQSFGIVPINTENTDFIVFAGHKSLYGPFGVGGFITVNDKKLQVTKAGGNGMNTLDHNMPDLNHERYEAGSPNTPCIYGLLTAIKWLKQQTSLYSNEDKLTKYCISKLKENQKIHLFLPNNEDVFGIISFSVDGYTAQEVAEILYNEFSISIRSGYHCAPHIHDLIKSTLSLGTDRISLSAFTKKEDIDNLIQALETF